MNKIIVVNDEIEKISINQDIKIETNLKKMIFEINTIDFEVKKNTDLFITIDTKEECKLQLNFNVLNNVTFNLYILTTGCGLKIKYNYNLNLNSVLNVCKYNRVKTIKEMVVANLNNEFATINYIFKTIAKQKECYDYVINHNSKNTISYFKNNGVNLSGNIIIQISSFIAKEMTDCITNQNNQIINLTEEKCEIRPILYIDNNEVEANHSALIGDFDTEELFYLQTMGISIKNAYNLLINGFLISDINNEVILNKIKEDIDRYWR